MGRPQRFGRICQTIQHAEVQNRTGRDSQNRIRKPLLYPAELRDRRNSAERHVTFSAAAPALPGRFFVHCHLPATFSSAVSAMTSIVSPIEGQFLGRLGPRFGEVPVSWRLRSASAGICFSPISRSRRPTWTSDAPFAFSAGRSAAWCSCYLRSPRSRCRIRARVREALLVPA